MLLARLGALSKDQNVDNVVICANTLQKSASIRFKRALIRRSTRSATNADALRLPSFAQIVEPDYGMHVPRGEHVQCMAKRTKRTLVPYRRTRKRLRLKPPPREHE